MNKSTAPIKAASNTDFARRVGVHYTMASRIRNGKRMPSSRTLSAIQVAFNISGQQLQDMMRAVEGGAPAFSSWVRENLFAPGASNL
jgi:transcriptional regulator with XRE-family HTH domain